MNLLNDAPIAVLIVIAVLGISFAAVLSAGEAAVLRVTRGAVIELAERHPHAASRVQFLAEQAAQTAASAAFVRVVAEMIATACITVSIASIFDEWWLVVIIATVVSALVSLVLVRVSPRTFGRHHPARVLGATSSLLWLVVKSTGWVSKMTSGARATQEADDETELRELVDRVDESDAIEDDERLMLRSVFELHDTTLREVMVPRTDMVTIEAVVPLRKAQNLFIRSGFSRVPVVGESSDEVLGVLFFKDAARVLLNSSDPDSKTAGDVMRSVQFYPESKAVDQLLREMQANAEHIAMAIDEYGGVAGLVTIEDILEEIVGDLTDEHDTASPTVEDLGDNTFSVPARLSLDDLGELFNKNIDDPDVDTVAGLLAKTLGKIPIAGSQVTVHGVRITADEFAGRRKQLSAVRVTLLNASEITNKELGDDVTTSVEEHSLNEPSHDEDTDLEEKKND
ncbi:hemolysin family protein [Timonella sp. A28]|uniref:hemolysin family protein n=1 Tax=Timonella sp. A28 TaxID=3442640 RepID=UPI003EBD51CB